MIDWSSRFYFETETKVGRDSPIPIGQVRIDDNSVQHNNVIIICSLMLLIRKGENEMTGTLKDPVCGMDVTFETAQARSEYEGQTFYFCSIDCKESFDQDPEKYIAQEQETPR